MGGTHFTGSGQPEGKEDSSSFLSGSAGPFDGVPAGDGGSSNSTGFFVTTGRLCVSSSLFCRSTNFSHPNNCFSLIISFK